MNNLSKERACCSMYLKERDFQGKINEKINRKKNCKIDFPNKEVNLISKNLLFFILVDCKQYQMLQLLFKDILI